MVIGELKLTFNLELVLQGVDRAAAGDANPQRIARSVSLSNRCSLYVSSTIDTFWPRWLFMVGARASVWWLRRVRE